MPEPRSTVRGLLALVVTAVLATGLAGCSGDDDAEAVAPRTALPTTAPALWNPCTALALTRVEKLLDTTLTRDVGTDDAPVCQFRSDDDGAPVVDVNYQLFDGTMDQLFDSFGIVTPPPGQVDDTTVTTVRVPASDGARLVVNVDPTDNTLALTGFVKNGDLVQVVNVLDLTPWDRPRLEKAVSAMLVSLAARADESGLDDD